MEFLSIHEVRKIAARKGCAIERSAISKSVTYVGLTDPEGNPVDGPGPSGG